MLGALLLAQAAHADLASTPDAGEGALRVWHFAEGNSRHEFQTFFSFLNLSEEATSVMGYYNRDDGIRLV